MDDILKTIEHYFVVRKPLEQMAQGKTPPDEFSDERYLRYGQLVWMAVPVDEFPGRGKSIIKTRMKPVILTYLASEDMESIQHGFSSRKLRINRMVRWCEEAYDQGALLTQLDLAVLLNVCDAVVWFPAVGGPTSVTMLMNFKEQVAGYYPPGATSMTCLEP